ncbi:TonB-dependent receptor plug domain-containing protein [Spongiivirga citrea]|uniref:TonB-dependent receptor plug domain-containing protein n=1 Tax=Spongiivirga citrea TaxID=1481457 RepID=A0A6M0CI35_9FLAO|nr:TonB-dependent receptor plug domain-containing protein [Spongiivirga citrea]NER16613.1 TonB-dependent receptor plug domain-containing protein [Spongiivirga citrea]
MKKSSLLTVMLFLFFVGSVFAQTKVSGTVSNNKNKPIAKALIYLDSINSNVKTDKKGNFEVVVPENVKALHVYSSKYGLLSHNFNGETSVNFVYIHGKLPSKDRLAQKDKVSIDYDETSDKYVAYKVETVEAEERIDAVRFLTIYDLIRDRVAGVIVSRDNRIVIRGVKSLSASQDPLFVVDGTILTSISHILPIDVDTISVLKGADAGYYGTQGANGVLVIKTKS